MLKQKNSRKSCEVLLHVFETLSNHKGSKTSCSFRLVDDTTNIAVIHGGCNNPGYKNKEALSTDNIVNAILRIGDLCQSQGVKDIFLSSLIYMKNNFQNNEVNTINNFLRSACGSLGIH